MSDLREILVFSIGMFHSEGYGRFQAVYSGIGYKESLGSRKLIKILV